jgi:peptide/nickel transport system substrate-binding protein
MKKYLFILGILLISLSILIGCAEPAAAPTPSSSPTPTATSTLSPTSTSSPTTTTTPTATTTPTPSETAKYGGTLKIMLIAGPQTPGGWPVEVFGPDATSYQFCMDPLLRSDNKGGVYPWLAESYQVADDLTSITFKLRKDVKFHDGTNFDAEAAQWNLDNHIAGMSSYAQYWASVDIVDDYTIKVNLRMWTNTALNSFADGAGTWMVSPTAFEKHGVDWMRDNPVGTGPFKFKSFQRDVSYKVVKNPDYWIKGKPYLDAIEILYVADPLTQKAAMQAGEADMLELEPGKMAKDLQDLGLKVDFQIITVYCFLPDSAHPDSPYADKKVREAVEYALDRESMAKNFSYGYWEAPYQIPPPSNAAYNPNFTLARKYDPDKAKQLLEEAGYTTGFSTTILVNPAIIDRNIAVALQSNLDAVGITAELSFPANMGKFIVDSNSLNNVLVIQPIMSSSNFNSTWMFFMGKDFMWNNNFLPPPEFLELREASLTAPTMDVNLIRTACDVLSKEAAAIPIMQAGLGWVMQSYIMGGGFFERGSSSLFASEDIWLKK